MTATLNAPAIPEIPEIPTPPPPLITEAILICSALALNGNPMAQQDIHGDYARRIVDTTRAASTLTELLSWRSHTEPGHWNMRWTWARNTTLRHFPTAPGTETLPLNHVDAPRATTPTP